MRLPPPTARLRVSRARSTALAKPHGEAEFCSYCLSPAQVLFLPQCAHTVQRVLGTSGTDTYTHTHKQTNKHCSAKVCSRLSATRKNSETADIRSHAEPMPCEEALDRLLRILSFDPIRESLQRKTTNYGKRDKALNWSA